MSFRSTILGFRSAAPAARRSCLLTAGVVAVAVGGLGRGSAADVIERRGGAPPLSGRVASVDAEGVTMRSDLGAEQVVPWDRVRSVQSESTLSDLGRQLERAELLWRARSRVERGDTALAEPLLERLFTESRGRTGETSLVIAEGLLRCRLARGEQVGAVIPALEVARLRRAGVTTMSYGSLAPVLDDATSLAPTLPPVFPAGPALARLHDELDALAKGVAVDPIVRALAESYRAALVLDSSGVPSPGGAIPTSEVGEAKAVRDHPGVALLRAVLAANEGGVEAPRPVASESGVASEQLSRRAAARQKLSALELDAGMAPWAESWRRFFAGTSRLGDAKREERRRGVVDLVHVTATSAAQQPWLSGVALAVASDALTRDGAAAASATLRREFELLHPHHALRSTIVPQSANQPANQPASQSTVQPKSPPAASSAGAAP